MTRTTVLLIVSGSLVAGAGASTSIAQQTRVDTAPSITLPDTHLHVLHSRVNGRTYRIKVGLPRAYVGAPSGDTARYPTLYFLDPLDNGAYPLLYGFQQVARSKAIVVGVSAVEPRDMKPTDREFDYTPPLLTAADSQYFTRRGWTYPHVGGAPKFLHVLKEEIIPLIDSAYRTSGDRGIEGVSFGGLFVAFAMLEEPDLFTRYSMVSPSLWYPWGREKGMILTREPGFAKQHPTFRKSVCVSVGSEENPTMLTVAWQFVDQLCTSLSNGFYKGLDLGAETIAGGVHGAPNSLMRGLNGVYPWDSTAVRLGRGVMGNCR
jgi:predicted alpha/beta superfamily hydrolase